MSRSTPTRLYLLAYNAAQLAGWAWALGRTLGALGGWAPAAASAPAHRALWGAASQTTGAAYAAAAPAVRACQAGALLETVHVLLGLVPGSPALAFLQWFGRSNVLFLILGSIPELRAHWAVAPLFVAWAAADVARYAWYAAALARPSSPPPAWLTWLRYSAFIPLYPAGIFAGEMPLIAAGLPLIEARGLHSLALPNRLNWGFSYAAFCRLGLYFLLPTAFIVLYRYLLSQRAKRLGCGGRGGGGGRREA